MRFRLLLGSGESPPFRDFVAGGTDHHLKSHYTGEGHPHNSTGSGPDALRSLASFTGVRRRTALRYAGIS